MGIYSEQVKMNFNIKAIYRQAALFGLPTPTEDGCDYMLYFTAADVKQWVDFVYDRNNLIDINGELEFIGRILDTHATNYIHNASQDAPESPSSLRKDYLRKATKSYRFYFC